MKRMRKEEGNSGCVEKKMAAVRADEGGVTLRNDEQGRSPLQTGKRKACARDEGRGRKRPGGNIVEYASKHARGSLPLWDKKKGKRTSDKRGKVRGPGEDSVQRSCSQQKRHQGKERQDRSLAATRLQKKGNFRTREPQKRQEKKRFHEGEIEKSLKGSENAWNKGKEL